MGFVKRAALALAATSSSHKAAAAALSGAATALVLSPVVEAALPFVAGFAGAVAVYAWTEPLTARKAMGYAVVSVALGGLAGPAAMDMLGYYLGVPQNLPAQLLVSFVCAATWPLFAPFLWAQLKALVLAVVEKVKRWLK